jgi:hypothetical protein
MVAILLLLFQVSQVVGDESITPESDYEWVLLPIWLIGMVIYSIYIIQNLDEEKDFEICQKLMSKIYQGSHSTSYKLSSDK